MVVVEPTAPKEGVNEVMLGSSATAALVKWISPFGAPPPLFAAAENRIKALPADRAVQGTVQLAAALWAECFHQLALIVEFEPAFFQAPAPEWLKLPSLIVVTSKPLLPLLLSLIMVNVIV